MDKKGKLPKDYFSSDSSEMLEMDWESQRPDFVKHFTLILIAKGEFKNVYSFKVFSPVTAVKSKRRTQTIDPEDEAEDVKIELEKGSYLYKSLDELIYDLQNKFYHHVSPYKYIYSENGILLSEGMRGNNGRISFVCDEFTQLYEEAKLK